MLRGAGGPSGTLGLPELFAVPDGDGSGALPVAGERGCPGVAGVDDPDEVGGTGVPKSDDDGAAGAGDGAGLPNGESGCPGDAGVDGPDGVGGTGVPKGDDDESAGAGGGAGLPNGESGGVC
jgi:hypothetical protein